MAVATPVKIGTGPGTGRRISLDPREKTGFKKPMLKSTKKNPYPSAPQANRAVMTGAGPALRPANTKIGEGPGHGRRIGAPERPPPTRMFRNKKMALRVGVLKPGLRGRKVSQRVGKMRQNLQKGKGRHVVDIKGPGKVIRTQGRTVFKGKNRKIVVTAKGSKIINKKYGNVFTQRFTPGGSRVVAKYGALTKTKADDARAVRIRGQKRQVVRYTKGDRSVSMVHRRGSNKLIVRKTGPKGTVKKVIGPKQTVRTGPGGKEKTYKTRYISQKRREKVTPRPNTPGYARGNTKPRRRSEVPDRPHRPGGGGGRNRGQTATKGNWKNVKKFRRLRRRQGARFNQSLTKGQLKAVTSRRLS